MFSILCSQISFRSDAPPPSDMKIRRFFVPYFFRLESRNSRVLVLVLLAFLRRCACRVREGHHGSPGTSYMHENVLVSHQAIPRTWAQPIRASIQHAVLHKLKSKAPNIIYILGEHDNVPWINYIKVCRKWDGTGRFFSALEYLGRFQNHTL